MRVARIEAVADYAHIRQQRLTVTVTSLTSMVFPFALALLAAPMLHLRFATGKVASGPFMLFLGISLSITAFPILARILEERSMQFTRLGATAIMCAAVDDVSAWSLLAIALTLIPSTNNHVSLSYRFLWLGAYLAVMLFIIRPMGNWLARGHASITLSYELFGFILIIVLSSAAVTDAIGIHPLFGAFLAGLCFPRPKAWQDAIRTRLDVIVSLVLLPLFFALTGMRTRLDLLTSATIWAWTGIILLVAIVGKMSGAIATARFIGNEWRDSFGPGALLNTRGLVELIVLKIAYDEQIFSPTLFTMLVVMALVTTMVTVPILNWLKLGKPAPREQDLSILTSD